MFTSKSITCNSCKIRYSPDVFFDIRIWTIDDVVKFTRLAKGTIYNKTSRGEIPFRKRGKKLFFIADEIMNWINEA